MLTKNVKCSSIKIIHKNAKKEVIVIKKDKKIGFGYYLKMYAPTLLVVILLNLLLFRAIFCIHYCYLNIKGKGGFSSNTTLISAAFTLFGFAITAKNILNYKHSDYFVNVPIKTIVEKSSTKLYYICFYNIIITPIFMLCLYCCKYELNLTPYIFSSFICFIFYLRKTYYIIGFKNIQDIISDVLLELSLQYNNFEIIEKRKNLLSSLFSENLKNISALDYVPMFNEYLRKTFSLLNNTYNKQPKSIVKKEIEKRYKNTGKKYIKQNIAVYVYEYLDFSFKDLKKTYRGSEERTDNLSFFTENVKKIIDVIFKFGKNIDITNDDLYQFYISAFNGLLVATLKNSNITVFDEICKYLEHKFSVNSTNCILKKVYLRNHFHILVVLAIDYCSINNYINKNTNIMALKEIYDRYITLCTAFTLSSVNEHNYNDCIIESMDIGFEKITNLLSERLEQFNKYPLFLYYKEEGYKNE